ncbi:hypothetical protein [Shewanella sp.]|uniref:hypothetical protein n=1 Tax=Shewanella sp. TaxID=50422 RepID=UPI001ECBF1C8|nr:hypothetical protein [Shewanella sp.]NRB23927.1 hypothetical protein [Shewanella sp.]
MKKATVLFIFLFFMGCSSMSEVPLGEVSLSKYIGEDVIVKTYSGDVFEFTVESATELTIYGDGITIKAIDIQKMEVTSFSLVKTTGITGGVMASIVLVMGLVFWGALGAF